MPIDPFFGSLVGAGANLLGSLFGGDANERASDHAANQAAMQREFATTGITWKARDVMRAYEESGIHPLQLLGAGGASYSPVSAAFVDKPGVGEALGKAGQAIEKGIYAAADRDARAAAVERTNELHKLAVERGQLENTALRMKIESDAMRMQQSPSVGLPNAGTPASGDVIPGQNSRGSNVVGPSWEYVKTPHGYMMLKSKAAQERLEDDVVGTTLWNAGHRGFVPPVPRGVSIGPHEKWVWRPASQEWQIAPMTRNDYRRLLPYSVSGRSMSDVPPMPFQGHYLGGK